MGYALQINGTGHRSKGPNINILDSVTYIISFQEALRINIESATSKLQLFKKPQSIPQFPHGMRTFYMKTSAVAACI